MCCGAQLAREVCYLIALDDDVIWRDASKSPAHLPDSRARWEAIWAARDRLAVIAHSHPFGPLGFSSEDESTMSALRAALGRPPVFAVVAPGGVLLRSPDGDELVLRGNDEPCWTAELRRDSGMVEEAGDIEETREEEA